MVAEDFVRQISAASGRLIERGTAPGIVCGVHTGGETFCVASGAGGPNRAMAETSRFPAGCLAKLFISTLCLLLEEEGLLSIHDPVAAHLPELAHSALTIHQLLTHSGGYREPPVDVARWNWSWEALVQQLDGSNQAMPAGLLWSYTQSGHAVLARIIERRTGKSLERNLAERLFDPLGLAALTNRVLTEARVPDDATLHLYIYKPQRRLVPARIPVDLGVLRHSIAPWTISVPELLRIGLAIAGWDMGGPPLLSPSIRERLTADAAASLPAWEGPASEARPAAWSRGMGRFGKLFGHTGSYVASTSALYIDLEAQVMVALSMNCWDPVNRQELAVQLLRMAGGAAIGSNATASAGRSRWTLAELAGDYKPLMLGLPPMSITPDGRIVGGIGGQLSLGPQDEIEVSDASFAGSLSVFPQPDTQQPALACGYSLYTR